MDWCTERDLVQTTMKGKTKQKIKKKNKKQQQKNKKKNPRRSILCLVFDEFSVILPLFKNITEISINFY